VIKLVDRYVGRAAILGILLVWSGLTLLYPIFSLLGELRSMQNDYGAADALWFVLLSLPRTAYKIFPICTLLGALVGVGALAASNELVAFRTSGVSRLRLALAALAGTLLLTVPVIILGEGLAPRLEQQARAFRLSELVGQAIVGGPRGVWMRDGPDIVNIQRPLLYADRGQQSVEFKNVVIYRFTRDVELLSVTRAENAEHDGQSWTLENVSRVDFDQSGASVKHFDQQVWATGVKPELLDSAVTRPSLLPMSSLLDYIDFLRENGLDDRVYQEVFWTRVSYPITVIALVLAGMPFLFGQARSQSVGVRLFFGMILGGLFMIVSRGVQSFGGVYGLSPALSIVLPSVLLGVGAVMVLRRSV